MIRTFPRLFFSAFLVVFLVPATAFAHQPRITNSRETVVSEPEISKAFYGQLSGEPDIYTINSDVPFDLYVNVLVPDIAGQKKDVSATVSRNGQQIAFLDGVNFTWKQFYEPFGANTYWMGPEYRASVEAGIYEIQVSSSQNDSKYSLAVGEIEAFDRKEGMNALNVIPELKKNFFDESPITFIRSPFGWGLIVAMYFLATVFGLSYRAILRKFAKKSPRGLSKNIGQSDRWLRFAIGLALLLWAITTTWNPLILFFSGFAFFEAIFSWCGFYAAVGKSTCPMN